MKPEELFAAVRAGDLRKVRRIVRDHPEHARAVDAKGATPLHYATEGGHRQIVAALLDAGGDINARDLEFGATPAGWAIEYLRERGALLAVEIEDTREALENGMYDIVKRNLTRWPGLRDAIDKSGTPLKEHARRSGNREMAKLFGTRL